MNAREQLDVLDQIAKIAELAGINGKIDEEIMQFVAVFGVGGNRSQIVRVRAVGQAMNKEKVVHIFSACLLVKKGLLSGISKKRALNLLKENEDSLLFGRYGIWSSKDEDMIVVSSDHMVATLDPVELEMHMLYIARTADRYEESHSDEGDDF